MLIIFAVIASFAVLREGLQDPSRNKFRLALHCIMILTSVVPPELPMELSLSGTEFGVSNVQDLFSCYILYLYL